MLYINPNSLKFRKAKKEYLEKMLDLLYIRIDNLDPNQGGFFFDLVINNYLNEIIIGDPHRLQEINDFINPFIQRDKKIMDGVKYVFNYEWFIDKTVDRYSAYHLADALDIKTCVYCNRNYTNTIISKNNKKNSRAQFDHFFDKGTNPLLALSFYNLIPSCSTCNSSIKNTASFHLTSHTHPYVDNITNKINFSYKYDNKSNDGLKILVSAPTCNRTQKNLEEFAIQEVYNVHTDTLFDLLKTKRAFSDRYLEILKSSLLRDVMISKEELYRLAFGTEIDEINFIKRPFSKFKKDILHELGIV